MRSLHLQELASAYEILEQRPKAKILKRIIRAEEQRNRYALLKRIRGRALGGGIDSILIDKENSNDEAQEQQKQRIFDPDEINAQLMEHLKPHFAQAEGSPFTAPPLSDKIGWNGTNDFSKALLRGDINTAELNVDEATEAILQAIKKDTQTPEINIEITTD